MEQLITILSKYDAGRVNKISEISTGLINKTYLVEAGKGRFILQKINPIFGKEVNFDLDAVSAYLEKKGMCAQRILPAASGGLFIENGGEIWRLLSFIPGRVFTKISSPNIACEAGKILGKFHLIAGGLDYQFRHVRPMHHATEVFFTKFKELAIGIVDGDFRRLAAEIPDVRELYLPADLRKNVTHGDPKISNIIFGEPAPGRFKAEALVDLDDCGRECNVLVELGDAFRSWCGAGEDDARNYFDIEKFKAGLSGYLEGSRNFLKREELDLLPRAIRLITLELAVRFLIDYIEDSYFGWDPSKYASRKEHNFARAKGQVVLYKDMETKSGEIDAIIKKA